LLAAEVAGFRVSLHPKSGDFGCQADFRYEGSRPFFCAEETMTRSHALKTATAACHLLLVVSGAARFFPACLGERAQQAVEVYGEYSGSSSGYGFFAPSVGAQWDAKFSCYAADGRGWEDDAVMPGNREVQLRVSTLLGMFGDSKLQEMLAASWAAREFSKYPEAVLVNVHVRAYLLPTMAEYRQGARPAWLTLAVHSFAFNLDKLPDEE
jgi:hypothetical protein